MSDNNDSDATQRPPLRKSRKYTELLEIPTVDEENEDSDSDDSDATDDSDPIPDREKGKQGQVSVKEAIEGLFSSTTIQSHANEIILVKRYSHGKTFRQRLVYISVKHPKTSEFIRITGLSLTILIVLLYIVEAITIDVFQYEKDDVTIECYKKTVNYSNDDWLDLILVPKPYPIWTLQMLLSFICLCAACFAIYVRQEFHGSLFRHFWRNFDFNIFLTAILGMMFFITIFSPSCLHQLFVPSFLYCWPARRIFLFLLHHHSQGSFFKHDQGFRTTFISLITFLMCFFISFICFIHHFERLGNRMDLFNSYWFTVVTFSTVGYGDITPGHWTGKLFLTIFIIIALVYLPSKLEKLWSSFQLHRKHNSEFKMRGSGRHVLFIAVSLKPLVLRDFLNEFYADPKQMDTQCVILTEQEVIGGTKHLEHHPVWSQRISLLLGSGLRQTDLARAKARTATACFIRTTKTTGSTETADRHTILCAWTVKAYAPKCKLYVQIIRPENRIYLHVADEIVCERELTNSLLALNTLCPGISTIAALLMHTFTYEGRGFPSSDYNWFEKCSPCEIYQIRLSESRYFHHFGGKNFLFSSVVAYRKFHVVLLGVRQANQDKIIFNPGIRYILREDDTCYYISDTEEEYSDYQVVKPTCFQAGLWSASATLGLLSMHLAGIDPQTFIQPDGDETDGKKQLPFAARKISDQSQKISIENNFFVGSDFDSEETDHKEDTDIGEQHRDDIGELDTQLKAEVCNWQQDVQVGLQLLKYHGESRDSMSKPVVKFNVIPKSHDIICARSLSVPSPTNASSQPVEPHPETIPETYPEVVVIETETNVNTNVKEELIHHRHKLHSQFSHPSLFGLFQRSVSTDNPQEIHHHHRNKTERGHSSTFLKLHHGDTVSLHSGASSLSNRSSISQQSHQIDPLVVLELDDISEKEELEDLEEGRTHDIEGVLSEEEDEIEESSPDTPDTPQSPKFHFNKTHTQIPVLPYCGCEPLHCHLKQPPRKLSDIQIDQACICEKVTEQWHERATLIYSDKPSPSLFHFLAPLRASYLPYCSTCIKPIVLILGCMPEKSFIAMIAELPMVYFIIGSINSMNDMIRAGITMADNLVILSPSNLISTDIHESLVDAENIAAVHKIARVFPHVRITMDITYRYNIRFLYTTPYEQWSLQHFRHMARKIDHLTYLFLPQVASGKAFSSSMLDTLLYQAYQKPHIVNVFRQLIGCLQVEKSGFLWKVPVTEELLKLNTYVRVFQRLASSVGYIPIGIYRSSPITNFDLEDIRGYNPQELDKLRTYLQGRLHSLGLNENACDLQEPQHQQFVFVNPPPDFQLMDGDIILVIRPPINRISTSCPTETCRCPTPQPPAYSPTSNHSDELKGYQDDDEEHESDMIYTSPSPTQQSKRLPPLYPFPRHSSSPSPHSLTVLAETHEL